MRNLHPTQDRRSGASTRQGRSPTADLQSRSQVGVSGRRGAGRVIAGLDFKEIIELTLLLIATGALSGFLAGVFGIGGGAILVPVFYECFRIAGVPLEVRMPLCVGTSLAVIIPTSIRSFQAHYRRGAVDFGILRAWWLPILIGVIAGSAVARYAPERLFKIVFVAVAYSASARLIFVRAGWRFGDDLPKGPLMRAYGFCVGILSTLMGIGGGLFSNLLMTFYGRPIHQAVATSSALAVLISIPGALGYVYAGWPAAATYPSVAALQAPFALGYVSLIGAVLVMPMSLVTAPLGVRAAHAMSKRMLEVAFGCYLFVVGSRFVMSLIGGQ